MIVLVVVIKGIVLQVPPIVVAVELVTMYAPGILADKSTVPVTLSITKPGVDV